MTSPTRPSNRPRRARGALALGCLALALALALDAPASAQPIGAAAARATTTLRLSAPADARLGLFELSRGRIEVLADGERCAAVPIEPRAAGAPSAVTIAVGLADQPEACRREGARVELVNGAGQRLHATSRVQAGAVVEVDNFAPEPPHTERSHPTARSASTSAASVERCEAGPAWLVAMAAVALAAALRRAHAARVTSGCRPRPR